MRITIFILLLFHLQRFTAAQVNVSFSLDFNEVCVPAVVQFTDNSLSTGSSITQWEWSINGVIFSSQQNPAYLVNSAGNYTICLKVWDALNNVDSLCLSTILVGYLSPTANFSQDNTGGCTPQTINFTDLSILGDAPINNWRWDFGDGIIDTTQQQPSHLYNTVGNFDVTLVITDTNNCSASFLQSNLITIVPQVTASISPNFSYLQCTVPTTMNFNGNSNTVGALYTWAFNDGTTATGAAVSKNFAAVGCYSPTLTVSNGYCLATTTIPSCITVSSPPIAQFTVADSTNCFIPFSPTINNNSSGLTSLQWDFGDGSQSNLYNPSHSYNSYQPEDSLQYNHGVFPLILSVSNNEGCTASDTQMIYISNLSTIILSPDNICAPDTFDLTALSFNISPSFYVVDWSWTANGYLSDVGYIATIFYPDSGLYSASVITTDNIGCKDTSNRSLLIGIYPSVDSITTDTNFVCRITGIQFNGFGSSYIDNWNWVFDDTSSFGGQSSLHSFVDTGTISGILITGFRGCYTTVELDSYYIFPPVAIFEPQVYCDTLQVDFSDASIGADFWYWDFGDTTSSVDTSTLQHPSYIYPDTGVYTATLIVYNDSTNCADTLRKIIVLETPYSYFDIQDSACAPVTLYTQNQSMEGSSWLWNAPASDSVNALSFDTKIHYRQPGIFPIRLFTFDINGCIDTFERNVYIAGIDNNILHQPEPACRPSTVVFTDSSVGILSPIVSWLWGNGSTQTTTNQAYLFPGPQEMPLNLSNDWGCSFDLIDRVEIGGLFVNFSAPQDICKGSPMTVVAILNASANAAAYDPFTLIWDFGDGQKDTTTNTVVNHFYSLAGVYDICLEVIDSLGCSTVFCRPNWVEVHDPSASFTADTFYSTCPPLEVNFSQLLTSGNQWNWSFGDGSVSSLPNPTHIYSTPGFYDVTLETIAFPGCSSLDTIEQMIQISGPNGFFYMPPIQQCAPYTAQLVGFGNNVASYTWLYDNGDFDLHISSLTVDSTAYTYTVAGTYSPTLVINDGMGCEIAYQQDSIVILPTPQAGFAADSIGCANDSIAFILNDSNNLSYTWFFENGQPDSSILANPIVLFADTGSYNVRLIVRDGPCVDSLVSINHIAIQSNPKASFDLQSDFCIPFEVALSDSSTTAGGFISNWQWSFGNGQSATAVQDTSISYVQADSFLIQLIVANNFGCIDTNKQLVVGLENPIASILADSIVCRSDTVQLSATGGSSYLWIAGPNLSDSTIATPFAWFDSLAYFTVVAIDSNQCQDTASISIRLFFPLFDSLTNRTICLGDTVNLPSINGSDPLWTGTNLSCNDCAQPLAYPYDSSTYLVTYIDLNNCPVLDSVDLYVFDLSQLNIVETDSICLGDSLQLDVSGQAGLPLAWRPNYAISSTLANNPIVFPSVDTAYIVRVEIDFCIREDSLFINLLSQPDIRANDALYCLGDSAILEAFGSQIGYQWQPSIFLSDDSIQTPISTAPYSIQYSVYGGNDCGVDSATVNITVSTPPVLQLDSIIVAVLGTEVLLADNLSNTLSYQWYPADELSCSDCPDPLWLVTGDQMFYVTVRDAAGCNNSDSISIVTTFDCTEKSLFIPNAFSPNNDGHNDVLRLQSSSIQSIEIFQVYSRWGQLVFETNDMTQTWSGRFRGTNLGPDVYGYYISFECPGKNKKIVKKGNITILR